MQLWVIDLGLTEFGRKELVLAQHGMQGMLACREEFGPVQSFRRLSISVSLLRPAASSGRRVKLRLAARKRALPRFSLGKERRSWSTGGAASSEISSELFLGQEAGAVAHASRAQAMSRNVGLSLHVFTDQSLFRRRTLRFEEQIFPQVCWRNMQPCCGPSSSLARSYESASSPKGSTVHGNMERELCFFFVSRITSRETLFPSLGW